MGISVTEKHLSREYTADNSAELLYVIRGTADEGEAMTALQTEAPTTFHNLTRKNCKVTPVFVDINNPASGIWDAEASYQRPTFSTNKPLDFNQIRIDLDTTGGTKHITQSIETVAIHAWGTIQAPAKVGVIGMTDDGVAGVDISWPIFKFTVTKMYSSVTSTYLRTCINMQRKSPVNDSQITFDDGKTSLTFSAGECKYGGFTTSHREDGVELVHHFEAIPNETNITIDRISGIDKKGWEYLWVRYETVKDDTAKALIRRPKYVFIEKVYELGNLSLLGL